MAHIIDDSAAALLVPVDVPTGWLCPYCKRVYGPLVRQCVPCSAPPQPLTGLLPRPKAEACCVCGSTEVTYHNFKDLPFCRPCANGEPLGNLKPSDDPYPERRRPEYCWRSWPPVHTETCGCIRPDGNPRLSLRLPEHMAGEAAHRVCKVGPDWEEVFPGLQCRLGGMLEATVTFRLTPKAPGEPPDA